MSSSTVNSSAIRFSQDFRNHVAGILGLLVFLGCRSEPPFTDNSSSNSITSETDSERGEIFSSTRIFLPDGLHRIEMDQVPVDQKVVATIMGNNLEMLYDFVRIPEQTLYVRAQFEDREELLMFYPILEGPDGIQTTETALFEAKADFLRYYQNFQGVLEEIRIGSATFTNIQFAFPGGNERPTLTNDFPVEPEPTTALPTTSFINP